MSFQSRRKIEEKNTFFPHRTTHQGKCNVVKSQMEELQWHYFKGQNVITIEL